MPFRHTCPDHPEWYGENVSDKLEHADAEHSGELAPIHSVFYRQGGSGLRIMFCRVCAARIETTDPLVEPYCEEHHP